MEFAIALVAVVAIAGFILLLDRQEKRFADERRAWTAEREGWIRLIQNPEYPPSFTDEQDYTPAYAEDEDDDELALVGTVMPGVGEADDERDGF